MFERAAAVEVKTKRETLAQPLPLLPLSVRSPLAASQELWFSTLLPENIR